MILFVTVPRGACSGQNLFQVRKDRRTRLCRLSIEIYILVLFEPALVSCSLSLWPLESGSTMYVPIEFILVGLLRGPSSSWRRKSSLYGL
jgi:hypothetical protein